MQTKGMHRFKITFSSGEFQTYCKPIPLQKVHFKPVLFQLMEQVLTTMLAGLLI